MSVGPTDASKDARGRSSPDDSPKGATPSVGAPSNLGLDSLEQSARDRAALAAALDPIVTIDIAGTVLSVSDSVLRVLGWTPAELVGRNVSVLMPEPYRSAHDRYLAGYHRTGRTNILDRPRRFEAVHKDGSRVPIELCVSRAEIPGGAPPLFVGIIRDMSAYAAAERTREEERIRAQQQLAQQTSALQQANLRLRMADRMASIGTLAAGLGHDMNNVLLPVRARLNALRSSGEAAKLARADRAHIDEIQKCVAYLQQLADGLHFLALDPDTDEDRRGGGDSTDLTRWWTQVGVLLSKAVPRHVRVTASFPYALPQVSVPAHGLTQAVLNLVVNAGEAIPPPRERKRKQGVVRIRAGARRIEGREWVQLEVTDNGSGMSEDVKRRAFEMFFTTKPRGLGTGLGLALVRNVVQRAGGRVELESELGRGTAVSMLMPAAVGAPSGPSSVRSRVAVTVSDGRAAHILRHLIDSTGSCVPTDDPASAHVWVVDPAVSIEAARNWRSVHPDGRLILFGTPGKESADAWSDLRPDTISATDDLVAVRGALNDAIFSG